MHKKVAASPEKGRASSHHPYDVLPLYVMHGRTFKQAAARLVRLTREPGGTPLANGIRALLLYPDESLRALADAQAPPPSAAAETMLPITEVLLLSAAFHERVRQGYLALAAAEPARWITLDATAPVEELAKRVWQMVSAQLTNTPQA